MTRPAVSALQDFLAVWDPTTSVDIADLYTFTLATGEVFRFSGYQTALSGVEVPNGQLVTTTATPGGDEDLNFALVPSWVIPGLLVVDLTNPSAIAPGTTVGSSTDTEIILSAGTVTPGVSDGDTLSFQADYTLGPPIQRGKTKIEIGTKVGELEVDVYAGENDMLGTLTWQRACFLGLLDGAYLQLDRAFLSPPGTIVGTITWFYGRVGEIDIGRTKVSIRVKSLLELLTIQMPRRFYQAQCPYVFGGAECLFDRSSMQLVGVAITGSSEGSIVTDLTVADFPPTPLSTPSPSTLYDQGSIIGLTGANAGYTRTIGVIVSGTVYYLLPWFFPVMPGDTFLLLPGCDHTISTCENTFNNLEHYGGMPYIPPPENAV